MPYKSTNPVILIGNEINAIGVIRSLSYCEIYLIYDSCYSVIKYSRSIKKSFRILDLSNENLLHQTLSIIKNKFICKNNAPVLLASCDEGARFLSKHRNLLSKDFIVGVDNWDTISLLTDKFKMYMLAKEHGIDTPKTYQYDETFSSFPIILKPRFNHFPIAASPKKAIKIFDKNSLVRIYDKLLSHTPKENILIQEYIPGPSSNIFSFCAYSKKGEILSYYMALNKIREFPLEFGVGTFAKTIYDKELENLGKKLISVLQYTGISEIDFKKDPATNKFKLLEINSRFYAQNLLGKACGIDLADIYYKELVSKSKACLPSSYKNNTYWLDLTRDVPCLLKDIITGKVSLKELLNFIINRKVMALFSIKDPLPYICEILLTPVKIFLNLKKILP